MRQGELLGLQWGDIDFPEGSLCVRRQLSQTGRLEPPKTKKALREVVLPPAIVQMLREHRMASLFKGKDDFVFPTSTGAGMNYRNVVRRGLEPAVRDGKIGAEPKLTFHCLRHTYASMLIDQGLTVVQVATLMGHADPGITLRRYTHLFDRQFSRDRIRAALEAAHGECLVSHGRNT